MSRTIADASRDYRNRRKERMARMEALIQSMVEQTMSGGRYANGPLPDDYQEAVDISNMQWKK